MPSAPPPSAPLLLLLPFPTRLTPQIPGSLARSIPEKLEYFDVVSYDPARLAQPPYELAIRSEAPFLGEKVRAVPGGVVRSRVLQRWVGLCSAGLSCAVAAVSYCVTAQRTAVLRCPTCR